MDVLLEEGGGRSSASRACPFQDASFPTFHRLHPSRELKTSGFELIELYERGFIWTQSGHSTVYLKESYIYCICFPVCGSRFLTSPVPLFVCM